MQKKKVCLEKVREIAGQVIPELIEELIQK